LITKVILKIVAVLPLRLSRAIGGAVGIGLSYLKDKDFLIARNQIQFALGLGEAEAEELARKSFQSVGEAVTDAVHIPKILGRHGYRPPEISGPELFPQFRLTGDSELILSNCNHGNGSIILSGHIGCIELLAAYYVARGLDLYAIARSPNKEWMNAWLIALRNNYRVKTIWREDSNSAKKILRALRSGGTISALLDQDTKLESEYSPFFNIEAASPSGLLKLAVKRNIPVLSCFLAREGQNAYYVRSKNIEYSKDSPGAVNSIIRVYNQELEAMIRDFPEQWVWWHKRWRRRPGVNYKDNPEALKNSLDYSDWLSTLSSPESNKLKEA